VVGGVLAVSYGLLTVPIPPGALGWFLTAAGAAIAGCVFLGDRLEQRLLSSLRGLGEGRIRTGPESLGAAVGEVFAFPDRAFLVNLTLLVLGTLAVGIGFSLLPGVTWAEAGTRIAAFGLALGPLTSTMAYLFLLERSRRVVARIAELGLSTLEVMQARPPRRMQLRGRLAWFTAVAVGTPAFLVTDVWQLQMGLDLDRIAAVPGAEQRLALAAALQAEGRWALAALVAVLCGMGLLIAFGIGRAISQPLQVIATEARAIASGDLRRARLVPAEDELWAVSSAFAAMQRGLVLAIGQLKGAAEKLAASTASLSDIAESQRAGADEQSASLNETSATTEELAMSAAQIAESGAQVAGLAERTASAAREGLRSFESFSTSVIRMHEGNDRIGAAVARLNKRVQQVGQVVEFIQGVGDKADLLALNAELEGTKAGEVGRGFSLVAAEMRRLAESVISSAQEIVQLITEIRDRANAAVMATESGLKAMRSGGALAEQLVQSLGGIVALADQTSEAARSISVATQQQQGGTTQLAAAMAQILRVTLDAQASGVLGGHQKALAELSTTLRERVEAFHLDVEEGARA
jgi:methyl-accepting chemotaxis protein